MLAAVLFAAVGAGRLLAPQARPGLRAFARESGVVAVLYALYMLAGELSLASAAPAVGRGQWVWDAERTVHLPSETSLQHALLPIPGLAHAANVYYIGFHVPVLGIFLAWCLLRHRDEYPAWRSRLALLSGACLLVQLLLPLAPPRLIGTAGDGPVGVVDTGLRWGPTVYKSGGGGFADQFAAMPSLHVGWALLVGVAAMRVGRSRWRYLGAGHAAVTVLVVVVTGNHFWLDGVLAALLLLLVTPVQMAGSLGYARARRWIGARRLPVLVPPIPEPPIPEPVPLGVGVPSPLSATGMGGRGAQAV